MALSSEWLAFLFGSLQEWACLFACCLFRFSPIHDSHKSMALADHRLAFHLGSLVAGARCCERFSDMFWLATSIHGSLDIEARYYSRFSRVFGLRTTQVLLVEWLAFTSRLSLSDGLQRI